MIDIDGLDEDELLHLNRRIVERLRLLQQMNAHLQMGEFQLGDRVQFEPPGRPGVTGMLTRFNRKTVTVISEQGVQWNVSPAVLKRLAQEERKPSSEAAGPGKGAPLSLVTVPKKQ
jgi:hypothetical protein